MLDKAHKFLTELGIDVRPMPYCLLVSKSNVNDLGGAAEVLEALRSTHGRGFVWNKENETIDFLVLTSVY